MMTVRFAANISTAMKVQALYAEAARFSDYSSILAAPKLL
jgi:hypothetical protein